MSQLFGYSIERKKKGKAGVGPSFVTKDSDDAAQPIVAGVTLVNTLTSVTQPTKQAM